MIDQRELRIGNLVRFDTGEFPVSTIGETTFSYIENNQRKAILHKGARGIPLSEEWLVKFGFVRLNGAFVPAGYNPSYYNKWQFSVWDNGDKTFKYNSSEFDVSLKFVHQLQNLYFALTQSELPISKPDKIEI